MRIDAYTHFIPEKFFDKLVESGHADIGKRVREIPCIHDLDVRRKVVDTFDDYAQILSYPMPPLELLAKGAEVEEYAKLVNDGFAEICAKYPDYFPGWVAQAPLDRARCRRARSEARDQERRARRADLHQYRRQAARRSGVRAVLCRHEQAQQADLDASGARRQFPRLSHREEIALRNLVDLRLVLRDRGRHGAAGVLAHHGQISESEDHHPPFRRHRADAGRPHRPGLGPARRAHLGRGLERGAQEPEEAAARLFQARLLRRHRGVRRRGGDPCGLCLLRPRQDRVRFRLPVRSREGHDVHARDAADSRRHRHAEGRQGE